MLIYTKNNIPAKIYRSTLTKKYLPSKLTYNNKKISGYDLLTETDTDITLRGDYNNSLKGFQIKGVTSQKALYWQCNNIKKSGTYSFFLNGKIYNVVLPEINKEGDCFKLDTFSLNAWTEIGGIKTNIPLVEGSISNPPVPWTAFGRNLFNINAWYIKAGSSCISWDISNLEIGSIYTIKSSIPLSWFKISNTSDGYNCAKMTYSENGKKTFNTYTFTHFRHQNIAESTSLFLFLGVAIPQNFVNDISELNGAEISITKGDSSTEYENFNPVPPESIVPSEKYPHLIYSFENTDISLDEEIINISHSLYQVDNVGDYIEVSNKDVVKYQFVRKTTENILDAAPNSPYIGMMTNNGFADDNGKIYPKVGEEVIYILKDVIITDLKSTDVGNALLSINTEYGKDKKLTIKNGILTVSQYIQP